MLKTHELLDRFELLYPGDKISDLRRAYIDKDLHSIFRLLDGETTNVDIEELRKAVVEHNLHSIFRVAGYEDSDLKKLILEDNLWKLWPILEKTVPKTQFISAFKNFYVNDIEINNDCFARGQLRSKKWLVEELSKVVSDLGTVFLCAGWYGTLATMLFESDIQIEKIRNFDIDPSCLNISKVFNKPWLIDNWKYQHSVVDITDMDFESCTYDVTNSAGEITTFTDSPDTVINTSCEHIENFSEWYADIPQGTLVILQSNNYFEVEDHKNCSETLRDFSDSVPCSTTLFEGELQLDDYTRFMKIGIV
jgi:hypothetical protein